MSDINTELDLPDLVEKSVESQQIAKSPAVIVGSTPRKPVSPVTQQPGGVISADRRFPVRERKPVVKLNL